MESKKAQFIELEWNGGHQGLECGGNGEIFWSKGTNFQFKMSEFWGSNAWHDGYS